MNPSSSNAPDNLRSGFRSVLFQRVGFSSIQGRLTAIAFVFIVGTAISMGLVGYRFTLDFESKRFEEHFNLLASYLASNAELGVLLEDAKILREPVENMLAIKDVQSVEIRNSNNKVIIRRENRPLSTTLVHAVATVVKSPIQIAERSFIENSDEGAAEVLGRVIVGYSLAGLEGLKKQLALGFVVISLLLAIVPVALYWKFSRAIRAPLQEVLQVAGKVSAGQLDIRVKADSLLETATLARAFNDMLDALQLQRKQIKDANDVVAKQRILAEMGKFSLTVAHEIKNPLAIIKGSLSVLRKGDATSADMKNQMINYIDEEVMRVNKLVEDFLLFARPQSPVFSTLKLEDLVAKLTSRMQLLDTRIDVKVDLSETLHSSFLDCDIALFERALFNVVRNALEAGPLDQPVRVVITSDSQRLVFEISDNGPGLNPEANAEIFEPFFSTKAKGTGLGLAIAKEVVKAHGGSISVANGAMGGAIFTIVLLLSTDHEVATS